MTTPDPAATLARLSSGLGARVLGRHFAVRPPGLRDQWLAREVLVRLQETGRTLLHARFDEGLRQQITARRASGQARVDSAAADLRRTRAVRAMVLAPQPSATCRPELFERLGDALVNAHDVARMVAEYGAQAPPELTDDGMLLQQANQLRDRAAQVRAERESWNSGVLVEALAAELDEAAELASVTDRRQGRILVLERCYEAAQQLSDLLISRADHDLIHSFTPVFVRLASLNHELGAGSQPKEA